MVLYYISSNELKNQKPLKQKIAKIKLNMNKTKYTFYRFKSVLLSKLLYLAKPRPWTLAASA